MNVIFFFFDGDFFDSAKVWFRLVGYRFQDRSWNQILIVNFAISSLDCEGLVTNCWKLASGSQFERLERLVDNEYEYRVVGVLLIKIGSNRLSQTGYWGSNALRSRVPWWSTRLLILELNALGTNGFIGVECFHSLVLG